MSNVEEEVMTDDMRQAIAQFISRPYPEMILCGCMGPRYGQPVCPCAMRWVETVNGKYYKISWTLVNDLKVHTVKCLGDAVDVTEQKEQEQKRLTDFLEKFKNDKN